MIPLDRVRAMLAVATPEPWTYERVGYGQYAVTPDARSEIFVEREHDAALIAAAPDLARDVLSLAAALATAERRADAIASAARAYIAGVEEHASAYDLLSVRRERRALDAFLNGTPASKEAP